MKRAENTEPIMDRAHTTPYANGTEHTPKEVK